MSALRKLFTITHKENAKSLSKLVLRSVSSGILDSGVPDIEIPKVSLPEILEPQILKHEKYTAFECGINGRKYTFGDFNSKAKNFSKSLRRKIKLEEGDVVALLLPNLPEFPIAFFGILQAGLVVTTMNPIYKAEEIHRQLQDSNAKVLVTIAECWETAKAAINLLKRDLPILIVKTEQGQSLPTGSISFNEFLDPVDFPEIKPRKWDDLAVLPYSSGTTGLPKGVQLTHYNLVSNMLQAVHPHFSITEKTTDSHQDMLPAILPMFHIYGMSVNNLSLFNGVKTVSLPKFTPEDYIRILKEKKPQVIVAVPPIVLFLTAHPDVKPEDLQSVRTLVSGAAPLGAMDEERFLKKANKHINVLQGYGLTETSPTILTQSIVLKPKINMSGSVGIPLVNTLVKIIKADSSDGTPLGPNTPGELLVKGPQVMKGYLNRPEENEKVFLDGWFRTGDIAYYNEDKIVYITDRLKELIKVKGFQVPPAELEEVIRAFPNVEEAAVIGIPHPKYGEVPRAFVLPKKGEKVNTKELEEFVADKVAEYKQLAGGVQIVDNIPKNASGKILRRQIKLEHLEKVK